MWLVCIASDGTQIRHLGPDPEFGVCIFPRKFGVNTERYTAPLSDDHVRLLSAIKT